MRVVENLDIVEEPVMRSCMEEIRILGGEMQGLKKAIMCLDDLGKRVRRASDIKGTYFIYLWPLTIN